MERALAIIAENVLRNEYGKDIYNVKTMEEISKCNFAGLAEGGGQ